MTALINTQSDSASIVNLATGQLTLDASAPAALPLAVGFQARKFKLTQIVGTGTPITFEWSEGMANSSCVMTLATGVQSLSTTLGPVVTERTVTIPAGALLASGAYVWEAQG